MCKISEFFSPSSLTLQCVKHHEVSGDLPAGCKIRHCMDKEMRPAPEEDIFTNLLERMKQKILSLRIRLNFLEQKWQVQFEVASCNFT